MSEEDWVDEFFRERVELYELLDHTILDESKIDTDMTDEELLEKAEEVLVEGPPDSKEEQIAIVLSSLKKQARDDPEGFVEELYDTKKRDMAKRLYPYESHEIDPFKPIFQSIRDFTDSELDIAGEWLEDFHKSDDGMAYSQQYHQLIENDLGRDRKITVDDMDSLERAVDVYSDIMNIGDAGYPVPVALSWIASGDDPRQKNAVSMGFPRGLQELESTDFEAVSTHIDIRLRHGIKHGDMFTDPKENQLRIEGGEKEYSFVDVETAVNNALLSIDMIQVMDTYVSLIDYRRNFEFLE